MRNLKKVFIICTIFFVIALLAGCSSSRQPEPAATEAPAVTPSPTATPAPISFEAAAEANRTELRTFSDYGAVFAALREAADAAEKEETVPETAEETTTGTDDIPITEIRITAGVLKLISGFKHPRFCVNFSF